MPDPNELFETALSFHRRGQWPQAISCFQQVLEQQPAHARAWHGLGLVALAQRDYATARAHLQQAVDLEPAAAELLPPLAEAFRGLGQIPAAIACYQKAIELRPDYGEAHCNLGTLWQTQGDLTSAAASYRRAIAAPGNQAVAHHNLGVVLQLQGDLASAATHFTAAARLNPNALESHLALGYVLHAQGKPAEAKAFFERAVAARPDAPAAHAGLGFALQHAQDFAGAERHFRQAVGLEPQRPAAHYNLATALRNQSKQAAALAEFQECIRLDPRHADAWIGLAGLQLEAGQTDDAISAARRALEIVPHSHAATAQLAQALHAQGDLDGAIDMNRRCLELDPTDAGGHGNLIYELLAHESSTPETIFAAHRAWGQRHADPLTPSVVHFGNSREAERPLRIGYVSAHFRDHAVAFFSEPMIAAHDHRQFEIHAYSDVPRPDETTQRFQASVDQWHDVRGLSDLELIERIRSAEIDILVDLAGHIGPNRLLCFARRPAPIQVTYLGYQGTTGMQAMDYRLTDAHADPEGQTDRYHTERLVRLEPAFFCYAAPVDAPPVNDLPARTAGSVTFASLNQLFKVRPHVWRTWAAILAAVPDSRLLVLAHPGEDWERTMRQEFSAAGVAPSRVVRVDRRPRLDYLRLHHQIDLALDSFPFNGHTTVCDALWMGVPSIMMEGNAYVSRFGGSALIQLGLTGLIAHSPAEYLRLAVDWATDHQRLAELRQTLRERMRHSSVMDARAFTLNLEQAYRRMWRQWCAADRKTPEPPTT